MLLQHNRTIVDKLVKRQFLQRQVQRSRSYDTFHREFFAGLLAADGEHARTAGQLMVTANEHSDTRKRPRLSQSTALCWKRECLFNLEAFTAGPHNRREDTNRGGLEELKAVRDRFHGEARWSNALTEQQVVDSRSTWIRHLPLLGDVGDKIRCSRFTRNEACHMCAAIALHVCTRSARRSLGLFASFPTKPPSALAESVVCTTTRRRYTAVCSSAPQKTVENIDRCLSPRSADFVQTNARF